MVIHFVRFNTRLAHEEVLRIMKERAPRMREVAPSVAATSSTPRSPAKPSFRVS